jgi:hypothetical protein
MGEITREYTCEVIRDLCYLDESCDLPKPAQWTDGSSYLSLITTTIISYFQWLNKISSQPNQGQGSIHYPNGGPVPKWLQIERDRTTFTEQCSDDGAYAREIVMQL